jgi:hypothetical protein
MSAPPDWTGPVKSVLARPPCFWCFDEDAIFEGIAAIGDDGTMAWLCEAHWEDLGVGTPTLLVHAAELQRLPQRRQVERYLAQAPWVYARTMPKHPHEYVLLRRSHDPWMHLRVLAYIRRHGDERLRRGRRGAHWWSYWTASDGREYWTMRSFDTILNRERDAPGATTGVE